MRLFVYDDAGAIGSRHVIVRVEAEGDEPLSYRELVLIGKNFSSCIEWQADKAKVNDILVPGPIPKWWDDGSEIADKEQKEEP